jgi:hypothetical protein
MRKIILFFICSTSIFLNTSFSEEGKNNKINNLENEKMIPEATETNDDKYESEVEKESKSKKDSFYINTQRSQDLNKEIAKNFYPHPKEVGDGVLCITGNSNEKVEFVVYRDGSGSRIYKDSSGRVEVAIPGKYYGGEYDQYKCEEDFVLDAEPFYFATTSDNKLIFRHPSLKSYSIWSLGSKVQKPHSGDLIRWLYNESDSEHHLEQLKQLAKLQWEYIFNIGANLYHPDDTKLSHLITMYESYNQDLNRMYLPKIENFPKQTIAAFHDIQSNQRKLNYKVFKLAVVYLDYMGKVKGVGDRDWRDFYQFLASHKLKELDLINSDTDSGTKYYDFNNDGFVDIDEFVSLQIPYLRNRIYYGGTNEPLYIKFPKWDYKENKINTEITSSICKQKFKYGSKIKDFKIKTSSNKSYQICLKEVTSAVDAGERCAANRRCRGEAMFSVKAYRQEIFDRCNPVIKEVNNEFKGLVGVCSDYLSPR